MNSFLKQSTASQVRTIGPFVDDTDFKTLKSALTIANTDIKLKKNGGASASKNSGGGTADGTNGLYQVTWDATDTATVGELSVSVKVASALVYFCTYFVLEEVVYDAMFGASAIGYVVDQPVNATKWAGNVTATTNVALKTTLAKTTDITGFNDLSAAQVNTEADTALSDVGLTTTVTGRIDAAVSTRAATGAAMTLTAAYDAAKTASTQASVDTLATYVDTEVAAIKAKTDQLTFTAGKVDANATLSLVAADLNAIADGILKRDWTAVSGEAVYSLLNAARMLRNAWSTPSGVLTVKKEDGATTAWTRVLGTDPAAQPIVSAT